MTVQFDFSGPVAIPRDAATVLLLREPSVGHGPPEIFMVKRNAGVRFMGGAYVFPGGRLDPGDADPTLPCDLTPAEAAARLHEPDGDRARALHVAALRECLEESGVLCATETVTAAVAAALRNALAGVQGGAPGAGATAVARSFRDLLVSAGVTLHGSALVPYARWVTPRAEHRRFDARFFLARCPVQAGRDAVHDGGETVASAWLTARGALERARAREIVLAPPTWRTLESLADAPTVEAMMHRTDISLDPVEPDVAVEDGQPVVILPGSTVAPTQRFRYDDGGWLPAA